MDDGGVWRYELDPDATGFQPHAAYMFRTGTRPEDRTPERRYGSTGLRTVAQASDGRWWVIHWTRLQAA